MAILKSFRPKFPVLPAAQPTVILISDDDSEVGNEYNCGVATGANVDDTNDDEAKDDASEGREGHANSGDTRDGDVDDEEVSDDAAEDSDGSSSPTSDEDTNAGNDVDAGDDASAVGDSSDYKTRGRHDAVDAVARDDTPVEDAIDSNVHDEPDGGDTADGVASNNATTVDEASNSDRNDGIDAAVDAADCDEGVAVEFAAIRSWLDRLEAKLNPSSGISQAISPRGKRKQTVPAMPRPKRQREYREVNNSSSSSRVRRKQNAPTTSSPKRQKKDCEVSLMATRAWVQSEDEAEGWEYTWRRGRGGHGGCWIRDHRAGIREEVDGEFLLCYSSDLAVEARANADWLPLVVRWNDEAEVFEGMQH
ncbi:hypothetical protein QQZ08_010268 [Neonectria magnoliae]|uniref:Uncharacterized protein n=1 Tax=Neonectria magnoliae TaxID=2732573 RepID=A0ABR1HHT7_9HYPO